MFVVVGVRSSDDMWRKVYSQLGTGRTLQRVYLFFCLSVAHGLASICCLLLVFRVLVWKRWATTGQCSTSTLGCQMVGVDRERTCSNTRAHARCFICFSIYYIYILVYVLMLCVQHQPLVYYLYHFRLFLYARLLAPRHPSETDPTSSTERISDRITAALTSFPASLAGEG